MPQIYLLVLPIKFHGGKKTGGNNINNDVPILALIEPNKPNNVNNLKVLNFCTTDYPNTQSTKQPIMVKPK